MRALAVALGLVLGLALARGIAGAADAFDVEPRAYRDAAAAGAVGAVAGRAYEERRRPDAPDHPLAGVAVTLVPRSAEFLARLNAIKRGARESDRAFGAAAGAVRREREAYERALWDLGAVDLVLATVVAADGAFAFDRVPAGAWVMIASRSIWVPKNVRRAPTSERGPLRTAERVLGFNEVIVWLREMTVSGERAERLELTDRNAWFRGIVEERTLDAGR